ncbi:MAG TPA: DMT family transporter [Anaeromyxobacter sp.]|nr:DMT family transporter [Anaeromyxobacter sp.]
MSQALAPARAPAPERGPTVGLRLEADGLMLLVTLLATAGWLFSRGALRGLPPLLFMGGRFALAAALLVALGPAEVRGLSRRDLRRAAATGVAFGVAMLSWIEGLSRASQLGVGAFICSLGVVLVPVVGRLLFRAQVSRQTWAAMGLGAVGLGLLFARAGFRPAPSDGFFAVTAVATAVHFNLNARYAARMPVRSLTAVQLAVVGGLGLLASALTERWPGAIGIPTLGFVACSIVLSTSLRFLLQVRAQSLAPLGHGALIMALEPVWTALVAAAVLGERMTRVQLLGCGLVMASLVASRLGPLYPGFLSEEG